MGGSSVSAPSTQARNVPSMLTMCTGATCSTNSWQVSIVARSPFRLQDFHRDTLSARRELDLLTLRLGLAEHVAAVAKGGGAALDRLPLGLLLRGAGLDRSTGVADPGGRRPALGSAIEFRARLVDHGEHRLEPRGPRADAAQHATAVAERVAQREHRGAGEVRVLPSCGVDARVHSMHRTQPRELCRR